MVLVLCLEFQYIWVSPNVTLKSYLTGVWMSLTLCKRAGSPPLWLLQRIPDSSYGYIFLDIMNVHWVEDFLPSDVCKVVKNPIFILKTARCLWDWLFSPTPTQVLEIKWLKSPCSWSCQAFIYPVSDEKSKQRLVFFNFFCHHLMCSSWLQR